MQYFFNEIIIEVVDFLKQAKVQASRQYPSENFRKQQKNIKYVLRLFQSESIWEFNKFSITLKEIAISFPVC